MSNNAQRFRVKHAVKSGAVVAALDIGCSKIACLIGRVDPETRAGFVFMGGGRQQSRGFNGGAITDMEALERSIRLAVEDAEREAGQRIDRVILGITGPKVQSELVEAEIEIGQRPVSQRDIKKVNAQALGKAQSKDREILGAYPIMYGVDDQEDIREPLGMFGSRLGVVLNVVMAPKSLVNNLSECVHRAHLEIDRMFPSAIASGAGCLIDDELENGALCIDFGGGVTTVCAFLNGVPAWLDLIRAGGTMITSDIAQAIGTTIAAAERIKTVYGTADLRSPGLAERFEAPRLGSDGRLCAGKMSRNDLAEIISPRTQEVFELIRVSISRSPLRQIMPRRTVLTGGTSQLPGSREVAGQVLAQPVRLGGPVAVDLLGDNYSNPAFSTAAGLISCSLNGFPDAAWAGNQPSALDKNAGKRLVSRIMGWLRENF